MNNVLKRLFTVMLVVLMCFNGTFSHILAEEDHDGESEWILSMEKVDPSIVNFDSNVPKDRENRGNALLPQFSEEDEVRVTVVLEDPAVLSLEGLSDKFKSDTRAMNYRKELLNKQEAVISVIKNRLGKDVEVRQQLTLAANAISVSVKYGDINTIKEIEGVKHILMENRYQKLKAVEGESYYSYQGLNPAADGVNITDAWNNGYTGAGSLVGIIDTGIDYKHISFDPYAFEYSIKQLQKQTGTTFDLIDLDDAYGYQHDGLPGAYLNLKIPYYYNYIDDDDPLYITHEDDSESNHGSHVAGIIAANRYLATETNDPAEADFTYKKGGIEHYLIMERADSVTKAIGLAPDAQLAIFKVFGKKGGAYDSDIISALEDALVLGCDTVNLSLGASLGTTYYTGYDDFYDQILKNSYGMVVCMAAGNDATYSDYRGQVDVYAEDSKFGTVSTPSTAVDSLSVASADSIGYGGYGIEFLDRTIVYNDYWCNKADILKNHPGTYEFIYMDADADDLRNIRKIARKEDLTGKILIFNAYDYYITNSIKDSLVGYQPAAVIVANTENRMYTATRVCSDNDCPYAFISNEDISYIKANSQSYMAGTVQYYKGSLTVTGKPAESHLISRADAVMSNFSSWGCPESLLMKPEITAFGGNVFSVFGAEQCICGLAYGNHDFYGTMSGTSMATPQMSALSALVKSYVESSGIVIPGYTARAITQSLLMSTATPMYNGRDYYSILQQGAGLVDVRGALAARSVIMMSTTDYNLTAATGAAADGKVKVELGADFDKKGEYTFSFRIYNISDKTVYYEVPVTDIFTQDYRIDADGAHLLKTTTPAGNQTGFTWTVEDAQKILNYVVSGGKEITEGFENCDIDGNGIITSYDAYLLLNTASITPFIPAGSYADVTVSFNFAADERIYTNGAYIEGFTYIVEKNSADAKGVSHTIPIFGYYGDWMDTAKFDEGATVVSNLYGSTKKSYNALYDSNMLEFDTMRQIYSTGCTGNQYMLEENNPVERYALRNDAKISWAEYFLVSGSVYAGLRVDKTEGINGKMTDNLYWGMDPDKVDLSSLEEGDTFRIGYYTFSEYADPDNAIGKRNDNYSNFDQYYEDPQYRDSMLDTDKRYSVTVDFTIDNTAPVLNKSSINQENKTLKLEASDNQNVAYIGIYSFDGLTKYYECAPAKHACDITIDASSFWDKGSFIVVVADYACNESAYLVKVADKTAIDKSLYAVVRDGSYQYTADFSTDDISNMTLTPVLSINAFVTTLANGFNKEGNIVTYAFDENNIYTIDHPSETFNQFNYMVNDYREVVYLTQLLAGKYGLFGALDGQGKIEMFSIDTGESYMTFNLNELTGCGDIISIATVTSSFYECDMMALDDDNNIWFFTLKPDTPTQLYLDKVDDVETAASCYKLTDAKLFMHLDIDEDLTKANIFFTTNVLYISVDKGDHSSLYAISKKYKVVSYLGDTPDGKVIVDFIQKYQFVGQYMQIIPYPQSVVLEPGDICKISISRWQIVYTPVVNYYSLDEAFAKVYCNETGDHYIEAIAPGTTRIAIEVPLNNPDPLIEYCEVTVEAPEEENGRETRNEQLQPLGSETKVVVPNEIKPVDSPIGKSQNDLRSYIEPIIKTKELVISRDEPVSNGLVKISYDYSISEFIDMYCSTLENAYILDEENGYLYVAFANDSVIPAKEPLITLNFKELEGLNGQVTVEWIQVNDLNDVNDVHNYELGDGHEWHFGKINWRVHGRSATATIIYHCASCGADCSQQMHVISRLPDKYGRVTFTAYLSAKEALDGKEHRATKTVLIPPVIIDDEKIGPLKKRDITDLEVVATLKKK